MRRPVIEKYKTTANRAEEQIRELLKDNMNIHRPWALVSMKMQNRTLDCISDETRIIFENNSNVRPGFDVTDDTVHVPNLFIKFSGTEEGNRYFYSLFEQITAGPVFRYDNFKGFCDSRQVPMDLKKYFNNDKLDTDALWNSDDFPYSFLRREYQELILNKIRDILDHKGDYFIKKFSSVSSIELLSDLLSIDLNLILAFNEFDFALKPPAVLMKNSKRSRFHPRQVYSLMLLNLLGFDIIILSGKGYSDIENAFNPEIYSLFYGSEIKPRKKLGRNSKIALTASAAVIITFSSIFIPKLFKEEDPPVIQDQQQTVTEDENPNDDITAPDEPGSNDDTSDVSSYSPDISKSMTVTKTKNAENIGSMCEIRIFVKDPEGKVLDISKNTITIQSGTYYRSIDSDRKKNHGNLEDDVFRLTYPYRNYTIYMEQEVADINYVITGDRNEYGYMITGTVPLGDYLEYNLIEIVYELEHFYKKDLNVTGSNPVGLPVYFAFLPHHLDITRPNDATFGYHGQLDHGKTKTIYSNEDMYEIHISGTVDDGIFYSQNATSFSEIDNISIDLDLPDHESFPMSINPNLMDYHYCCIRNSDKDLQISTWCELPESPEFFLYTNADIDECKMTLSKSNFFEYESSISYMPMKEGMSVGMEVFIEEISIGMQYGGSIGMYNRFADNDYNTFYIYSPGYSDISRDPLAVVMEIYQDDTLVKTELFHISINTIDFQLENGIYTVKIYPAKSGSPLNTVSYFNLVANDMLKNKFEFSFLYYE